MSWSLPPLDWHDDQVVNEHRKLVQAVGVELGSRLVRRTPVDTGRARGGWIPSISKPSGAVSRALDPSGNGAIRAITQTFASSKVPAYPVLYISNNVEYIGALNDGHSQQAPAQFVEMAVAEMGGLASIVL